MFADIVESVRLIERDERRQAPRVSALLDQLAYIAQAQHGAELLERRGDGLLLRWQGQEQRAVACALDMARAAEVFSATASADVQAAVQDTVQGAADRIVLRFGLHSGVMLSDGQHVYGSQVNLTARIAALAQPGQIVMTQALRDQMVAGVHGDIDDLGECWLKHASEPVHVYRLSRPSEQGPAPGLPEPELPRPCVAVLPLRAIGFDDAAQQSAVLDLLGENMVHVLGCTDRLTVVSWFSTRVQVVDSCDVAATARRLNANWLVCGSCSAWGGGLTVALELLDAQTATVAWTCRLSTTASDLMSAEPAFAAEVAKGIIESLCEADARCLGRHALPNLASHTILSGAIGLMHRSARGSFMKSREALEYLLDRHPRMHAVRPWLAQWYVLKNTRGFGQEPQADAARALDQAHRALDALPDDARALALLGFSHFHLLHNADAAECYLDQAMALNPNDPLALIFSAGIKNTRSKPKEGLDLATRALRITPFDPLRHYFRAIASGCSLSCGDFTTSVQLAEDSIRENATHPYAWRVLLIASACLGDLPRAQRAHRQLQQLGHHLTVAAYRARSMLAPADLALAERALRAAGVPEH